MMANYKNMRFSNTTEGFKSWNKNFPPMDPSAVKATGYQKKDDYYLECQLVQGFLGAGKFVSTSVRMYDPESADFEYVGMDKANELLNTVFKNKVESFKAKHL